MEVSRTILLFCIFIRRAKMFLQDSLVLFLIPQSAIPKTIHLLRSFLSIIIGNDLSQFTHLLYCLHTS